MIHVKVMIPGIDKPYFDSTVNEADYDKFKKFLDELNEKFGEGNIDCTANVVKDDKKEEVDPIAEHIKDHPLLKKTSDIDSSVSDFLNKLDKIEEDNDTKEEELKETKEEFSDKEFCKVVVNITKFVISDIYYRENPEIKQNAVDKSYPVFDEVFEQIVVPIPLTVLDKCTAYNIAQFIKQNTIFILMDPEYCEIEDDDLDKVFDNNNFDDSYCYDTGVYKITFDAVQFPCCPVDEDPCDTCLDLFKHGQVVEIVRNSSMDYREMEKVYTTLRLFNKE